MVTEPPLQPAEPPDDATSRREMAQHLSNKSWGDAIDSYENIVERLAEDHWKVGQAYLALRREQKALQALEASLKLAKSGQAHALLAALHADESSAVKQRMALNHALRAVRHADCPEAGFLQALESLKAYCKRDGLSYRIALRGCRRFSESPMLQKALADGHYHQGEPAQAYHTLAAVLDADATAEVIERAYRYAMAAGEWPSAIKQANRLPPTCAWLLLGDAYAQAGEVHNAVASFHKGLDSDKYLDQFLAHLFCASAWWHGDETESLRHLLLAGKLLPYLPHASQDVGVALCPGVLHRVDCTEKLRRLTSAYLPGGANCPLPSHLGSDARTLARLAAYAAPNPAGARDWRLRAAEQQLSKEHAPQAMRDYLHDGRYREGWDAFWLAAWKGPRDHSPRDLEGWDHTWPLDSVCVDEFYREVQELLNAAAATGSDLDPALVEICEHTSHALWFGGMFSALATLSASLAHCMPKSVQAWRYLAQAQEELGCDQKAKASYAQLLALIPGDKQAAVHYAKLDNTLKVYGLSLHEAPLAIEEGYAQSVSPATQAEAADRIGANTGVGGGALLSDASVDEHRTSAEPPMPDLPPDPSAADVFPLKIRLYLAALLEHGCSPSGIYIGSILSNGARNLSPTRAQDREIILTLCRMGYITPHPDTPLASSGGPGYPFEDACWQLSGELLHALGDRALDFLKDSLDRYEAHEATALWREVALEECVEYLIRECGYNHWDYDANGHTRHVLSCMLAKDSTAHVQAHICYACRSSATDELRKGISPQEGMAHIVSRIYQRWVAGFGTHFQDRYYLNKMSTLSRLFHDQVLGTGAERSYHLGPAELVQVVAAARASVQPRT